MRVITTEYRRRGGPPLSSGRRPAPKKGSQMNLALLIGLAASVALLLTTIRVYERRIQRLQADLDFAIELLEADPDQILGDLGRSA